MRAPPATSQHLSPRGKRRSAASSGGRLASRPVAPNVSRGLTQTGSRPRQHIWSKNASSHRAPALLPPALPCRQHLNPRRHHHALQRAQLGSRRMHGTLAGLPAGPTPQEDAYHSCCVDAHDGDEAHWATMHEMPEAPAVKTDCASPMAWPPALTGSCVPVSWGTTLQT